jgi:predicted SAM-dependent methyltransferase
MVVKLDLGCGDNKREGFTGVDKYKTPSVDIEHDLFVYPWPFESDSVDEVHCSHFFEHVPGLERPKFMDELYRVMKPKAQATIIVPYARSPRSIQDYTHQWPPLSEESFLYFNKTWREQNKLTHGLYDLKCDFDFGFAHVIDNAWAMRAEDARAFAIRHYWSVIADIQVILTKREITRAQEG